MNFLRKKIRIVTHDGNFHADDVFACATLSLWANKQGYNCVITRTREANIVAKADIVVDVGMEYDPERGRFDHHQRGGAGTHENGIPYASFGLVWKHYASFICGSEKVSDLIRQKLVVPIDAMDNGVNISKPLINDVSEYRVNKELIYAFRTSWKDREDANDRNFQSCMAFAVDLLVREIKNSQALIEGESIVMSNIKDQSNPEILILDQDLPWERVVSNDANIKVVIYPEPPSKSWCLETVRTNLNDYNSAKLLFPESWRGLRGDDLEKVCGVAGAIFCHRAGFFAVNKSKEGAIKMAKISLQNFKN